MKSVRSVKLDDACNVEYGTRVVQKRDGGQGYPVYGGGGATFEMDVFNREDRLVIARFGMSEICARLVTGKFFLNDSGLTVSPKIDSLNQRFLDYQLLSMNDDIYALGKGAAQKNLDVSAFRGLLLFVPPIEEQERIVTLLDEALVGLVTAQSNAEVNHQHALAIFESQLHAVCTTRGSGWCEKTIGEVSVFQRGLTYSKADEVDFSANVVLRATNVDLATNLLNFDELRYIDDRVVVPENKKVAKGSLLICMASGSKSHLGKVAYIDDDRQLPR